MLRRGLEQAVYLLSDSYHVHYIKYCICNSKSPLHNGLNSKNVLMSYLYAILVLSTLYGTTPRSIICEKYRILTHLFTYSKQTYKCHEFFFISLSTREVKWSEVKYCISNFFFKKKNLFHGHFLFVSIIQKLILNLLYQQMMMHARPNMNYTCLVATNR